MRIWQSPVTEGNRLVYKKKDKKEITQLLSLLGLVVEVKKKKTLML